jgi:hypothetical protein
MESILGVSLSAYVAITVVLIGFAAYMTGQALANTWRPYWQVLMYCALLGGAARFFVFALAGGDLLRISGYLVDVAVLGAIGSFAYRLTRARKMVAQYPWIYERQGLFGWRARH